MAPVTANPRAVRAPLVLKWTLFVGLTLAGLIAVLLAVGYVRGREILLQQIHDHLSSVAASRRDLVEQWVGAQRERAVLLAERGVWRSFLREAAAGPPDTPNHRYAQNNLIGIATGDAIRAASLADAAGRILLSSDPADAGRDMAGEPAFQAGLAGTYIDLPQRTGDRFTAVVAAPVLNLEGKREALGVLLLTIDVTALAEALRDTTGLGQSGEVLLGVREGERIRYLFPPRQGEGPATVPLAAVPALAEAGEGWEFFERTRDHRGEPVLAAGRPVGYGGWGLVAQMDEREAYAPVARTRDLALMLAGLFALVGLAGAFGLARGFTRPIRRLARAAEAVAGGNLDVTVPAGSADELGDLAASFNTMTASLRTRTAEREQAEAGLRQSEQRKAAILESALDCIVTMDHEGNIIDFNPAAERTFGHRRDAVVGRPLAEVLVPPRLRQQHREGLARFLATGQGPVLGKRIELPALRADGSEFPVELAITVTQFDDRPFFTAYLRDITERKRAEDALRHEREFLRQVIDATPSLVFVKDWDGRFLLGNQALARSCGTSVENLLGKTDAEFNRTPEQIAHFQRDDREVISTRQARQIAEEPVTLADGQVRWFTTVKVPLLNDDGTCDKVLGVATDITERRQAEQRIKASLREKEALLKEVHHRVKNNMQVISSLLNLQAAAARDPAAVAPLREARDRVQVMALVHEQLYRSADLGHVNFAEYARGLIQQILRAHERTADVRLKLELEPLPLGLDVAIPCGLILNELTTNALKHAFRGRAAGEVAVAMRALDDQQLELVFRDDGVGLPDSPESGPARSLGLKLVRLLTDQLGGRLEISVGQGTEFRLTLPRR